MIPDSHFIKNECLEWIIIEIASNHKIIIGDGDSPFDIIPDVQNCMGTRDEKSHNQLF
jgi:hypothetical protein